MTKLEYTFDSSRPLLIVDQIIRDWSPIVVPIFIKDPNSSHRFLGLGSGFIVTYKNEAFLVTAGHVVKGLTDGRAVTANISGKPVLLNQLKFMTYEAYDLAIAHLPLSWAKPYGLISLKCISLEDKAGLMRNNLFILLGYPGSKNKLNTNTKELNRTLVGYSTERCIETPQSDTHVHDPIAFHFNKNDVLDSDEKKANVGPFNGNSGGPVIQINSRDSNHLSVSIVGVFIGWDKDSKELICTRRKYVEELIESWFSTT